MFNNLIQASSMLQRNIDFEAPSQCESCFINESLVWEFYLQSLIGSDKLKLRKIKKLYQISFQIRPLLTSIVSGYPSIVMRLELSMYWPTSLMTIVLVSNGYSRTITNTLIRLLPTFFVYQTSFPSF